MNTVTDNPEIYCLGSGSSGNCYIINFKTKKDDVSILVEAGLSYKEIVKRATEQRQKISQCKACLITHAHGDHAKAARTINDAGIPVYASRSTLAAAKVDINKKNVLEDWQPKYITSTIAVLPFIVEHDAPESMGFVIKDISTDKTVLFINDCRTVKADISKVPIDVAMVECNYSDDVLKAVIKKATDEGNKTEISRFGRIRNYHMGLRGCRLLLNKLKLRKAQTIILMHLSNLNSSEEEMKQAVRKDHPNCNVFAAQERGGFL